MVGFYSSYSKMVPKVVSFWLSDMHHIKWTHLWIVVKGIFHAYVGMYQYCDITGLVRMLNVDETTVV
jgi:hypothetical protein